MQILSLILVLAAVSSDFFFGMAAQDSSSLTTKHTRIIELTDENFEHMTQASTGQTTGKWFVSFSSPQCTHCRSLHPKWQSLADEIMQEHSDSGVLIGLVDVTKNSKLVNRFSINSMPTLYLFADMGMYQYAPQKPRNVEAFLEFVLGGYASDDGERMDVPTTAGGLLKIVEDARRQAHGIEILDVALKDFEHIVLFRKNAAFFIFGAGVIFGIFLCMAKRLVFGSSVGKKVKLS